MAHRVSMIDQLESEKVELRWRSWWRYAEGALGHHLDDGGDFDGFGVESASESFRRGETPADYVATVQSSAEYKAFVARLCQPV